MRYKYVSPIKLALLQGYEAQEKQNKSIQEFVQMQSTTLSEILRSNQNTEYGLIHGFSDIISMKEYADKVPLSTYRVYKPYIHRLIDEKCENLLCSEPLTGLASTSATSGNAKFIPQNKTMGLSFLRDFGFRGLAIADQIVFSETGKYIEEGYMLILMGNPVRFLNNSEVNLHKKDKKNIAISSISAVSLLQVEKQIEPVTIPPLQLLTDHTNLINDMNYLYLRFGLPCRNIVYCAAIYDDYVLEILRYLNFNREFLCDEIEKGLNSFPETIVQSEELKEYQKFLQPNPSRAKELRDILKDGIDKDTLHRIWPKLKVLSAAAKVGEFVKYSNLDFYLEKISYDCSPYGATEGLFGVSAGIDDRRIQLLPYACYYEFIPYSELEEDNPNVLTLDELRDGFTYELVITSKAGLYRYRMGDLLQVTGRKGNFPLFSFIGRRGIGIDLVSEKTPAKALRDALTVAAVRCRIPISACCMYGYDGRSMMKEESVLRYIVQFESKKLLTDEEKGIFEKEIDHQISSIVKSYAALRNRGVLQPVKIIQMELGTFLDYENRMRMKSSNPGQYKRPFIMMLGD